MNYNNKMCACRSPSWTNQQDEALEDGSDHGPTKEESCEATKTDDLIGDLSKINQIETNCRERVSHGDGIWRADQQPWSIDEHSLSLEDLDTPMYSPDNPTIYDSEYLNSLSAWMTDELPLTDGSEPSAEKPAYLGKPTGNAPDSGNDRPNNSGGYFWECPSPYPPNFGSENDPDAALLENPPSPCLSPFDCAGSSLFEASQF